MTMTPLFHATIGGQTGLCFALGPTTVFTTMDDERLYRVEDVSQMLIMAPVEPGMAAFLTRAVIEPRLERIGGAP
jgi:hypothetical protein